MTTPNGLRRHPHHAGVTISRLLGHSSITVTARCLDHLTNIGAVEALRGIELPPLAS
jgi:hypothetical protein